MKFFKGIGAVNLMGVLLITAGSGFAGKLPLAFAGELPVILDMISGATQVITFTIINNTSSIILPLNIHGISNPVRISAAQNDCTANTIAPGASCNLRLSIRPNEAGAINQTLVINYDGRFSLSIPISLQVSSGFNLTSYAPEANASAAAFVGVDYAPGHYPENDLRNQEDQANVSPELSQLQSAGFATIRMYGEPGKTWIAAINAAKKGGMRVIYQLATCKSDPTTHKCIDDITGISTFASALATELTKLQGVINQVGTDTFKEVVPMVLIGNENYITVGSLSNIGDLISAATQTRAIIDPLNIPVTISLQGDVWISTDKNIIADLNQLITYFTPNAPLGVNVYPFQWVMPVAQSVSSNTVHSIEWYLSALNYPKNPIFFAETGWATAGNYIVGNNKTTGSLPDAIAYYPQLYPFLANTHSLLAFMAFDVPTKTSDNNLTSENFYGVFDDQCRLKSKLLLANANYNVTPKCSSLDGIFSFGVGSNTAQPPFTMQYNHAGSAYVIDVPTADHTNLDLTPSPTITLAVGDTVTLVSSASRCTNTVATVNANHSGGTWSSTAGTGTGNCNAVNWANGQTVFMPAAF